MDRERIKPGGITVLSGNTPLTLTKEQLKQIADMLVPYIENKIFGDPKIDLDEQKNWTPEQRTRFVARLIAKGGM